VVCLGLCGGAVGMNPPEWFNTVVWRSQTAVKDQEALSGSTPEHGKFITQANSFHPWPNQGCNSSVHSSVHSSWQQKGQLLKTQSLVRGNGGCFHGRGGVEALVVTCLLLNNAWL
jgi:hypothetical protein